MKPAVRKENKTVGKRTDKITNIQEKSKMLNNNLYSEDMIGLFGPSTKDVDPTLGLLSSVTNDPHSENKEFLVEGDELSSFLPPFGGSQSVDVNDSFLEEFSGMPMEMTTTDLVTPVLSHADSLSSTWTTDEEDSGFSSDSSSLDEASDIKAFPQEKSSQSNVAQRRLSDLTSCDECSGDESDLSEHEFALSLDEHMMPEEIAADIKSESEEPYSNKTSANTHGVFIPALSMLKPTARPDPRSSVLLKDLDSRLRVIAAPRMDTCFTSSIEAGQAIIHNPELCDICCSNKSPYRKAALHRYRAKRANRDWRKGARYGARSAAAFTRKRHNGRFAGTVY